MAHMAQPDTDFVQLQIRIPRTLHDRLKQLSDDRIVSKTKIAERAIEQLVTRLEAEA
jgi:predicted transcriptional regulator